ncbi:hypothetical protein MKX01_023139, partial [Papaver californicum]
AEIHRKYIFGGHVGTYMRSLMEDEPEKFQTHLSEYAKRNIVADCLEALYKKVHAAIPADPTAKKTKKPAPKAHKRWFVLLNCVSRMVWQKRCCLLGALNWTSNRTRKKVRKA